MEFRSDDPKSTLGFGFIAHTKYKGGLVTVPVANATGRWSVDSVSYSAGGRNSGLNSRDITFDTGGVGIFVDVAMAQAYQVLFKFPTLSRLVWVLFLTVLGGNRSATALIPGSQLHNNSRLSINGGRDGFILGLGGFNFIGAPIFAEHYTVSNQSIPSFLFAPKPMHAMIPTNAGSTGLNSTGSENSWWLQWDNTLIYSWVDLVDSIAYILCGLTQYFSDI